MEPEPHLAPSDEVHSYLVGELNDALRRPEMWGGEVAIRTMLTHLLVMERDASPRRAYLDCANRRGMTSPTAVRGALEAVLPDVRESDLASVAAEFARARGWLFSDRLLDADEYAALHGTFRTWAGEDRQWPDVAAAFGPPSVLFGSTNPLYGKTLGYASQDPTDPMVFFHLWNGSLPGEAPTWPPPYEQPLLIAVRSGYGPFAETFTHTPEGHRRQAEPTSEP